jgi:hypothetical protein
MSGIGTTSAFAQAQCGMPGVAPASAPSRLFVDCATRRNFALFRANPEHMDLTGVVTVNRVVGKFGNYETGSLMLFPRLKPKGIELGAAKVWPAFISTGNNQVASATPIKVLTLPADDYFCRFVLQAPWTFFIGFSVDNPFEAFERQQAWASNVDKLPDGKGVGIGWSSANLNAPWFGGSRWIPQTNACQGAAWRNAIVDGLAQASVGSC